MLIDTLIIVLIWWYSFEMFCIVHFCWHTLTSKTKENLTNINKETITKKN
jgi:hypothetical protein